MNDEISLEPFPETLFITATTFRAIRNCSYLLTESQRQILTQIENYFSDSFEINPHRLEVSGRVDRCPGGGDGIGKICSFYALPVTFETD